MEIVTAKSKWEVWSIPLRDFVGRAARAGFQAMEICLSDLVDAPATCRNPHAEFGLCLIGRIAIREPTLDGQFRVLERKHLRALEFGPIKINAHLGATFCPWAVSSAVNQYDYDQ
jgi:hypothetical protein